MHPQSPAYESALKALQQFCSYRERCRLEVMKKLDGFHLGPEVASAILAALQQEDFLNETRYAKAFASGKFRINRWGRARIMLHLKSRMISAEDIRAGLAEIDEDEYIQVLRALMVKKAATLRGDKSGLLHKISSYSLRKGYEPELVYPLAKEVVNGQRE